MDAIESFLSDFIVRTLHKSVPTLTPDDDAKVQKAISDLVSTAMDLAGVYFAIRNARAAAAPAK